MAEVKRLQRPFVSTATAAGTNSAGTIRSSGDCYLNPFRRRSQFRRGPNSWGCVKYRESLERELPHAPVADVEFE